MEFLQFDMITKAVGRVYLSLKHRNPIKRRKILFEEYNGSYHVVGREAIFWTAILLLVLLVLGAVVMTILTTVATYST